MARLVLCVLVLCAVSGLARFDAVAEDERDLYLPKLSKLFQHVNEPLPPEILNDITNYGNLTDHLDKLESLQKVSLAVFYNAMLREGFCLPRGQPFSINDPYHAFEVSTLFNVLAFTTDLKTFYDTAAYLRDKINEGMFVYALSTSVVYNKHSQNVGLSPIFEIFPNYFHNAETMNIIKKISVYGSQITQIYPYTSMLGDDKIVINANSTYWPYGNDKNFALSYFTNDIGLNSALYQISVVLPGWIDDYDLGPHTEDLRHLRGITFWLTYRQLVARYYMERLSNGLGEIPDITNVIEDGFNPGLLHYDGVPFPSRPDNYRLDQPHLAGVLEKALKYEKRIWRAIDQGFYINRRGEEISLLSEDSLNNLGGLIESHENSPNRIYYKDFIGLWKKILGNTIKSKYEYQNGFTPLTVPSALEKYETALRDPAFYMLYKRVLKLFVYWQKQMPLYKSEELAFPGVEIEKIETDKLVTYFEPVLVNATQAMYRKLKGDDINKSPEVFVKYEHLTHRPFSVNIKVKSEKDENVVVKLFLAPKYDSKGLEIPLHLNTENFYMLEFFPYPLSAGESVITREFTDDKLYETVEGFKVYKQITNVPPNLRLPKGNAGGQVFQLVAYIQNNVDASKRNVAFPSDRPLHSFQLLNVKNIKFEDIKIYHEE